MKTQPKQTATQPVPTNWNDFAAQFKKCFVRYEHVQSQATRQEPSRELSHQWVLFLPSPCVVGTVACKTINECRTVAASYGCTILL